MVEVIEAYKFVDWEVGSRKDFLRPIDFLMERYSSKFGCGLDELKSTGRYKLLGWSYDFKPYLKRFLVKRYGSWSEYFAPNRTLLRKCIFGRINKIVELVE